MKLFRILLIAVLALVSTAAYGRKVPGDKVGATIDQISYDFGTVNDTDPAVVHSYTVTNSGSANLSILWVKPKCGCTVPDYPRKPLKPGESAKIKVTFMPKGQNGEVDKDIRVKFRNGQGKSEEISLRLRGNVLHQK